MISDVGAGPARFPEWEAGWFYDQPVTHYVVPYRDSGDDGEELRYSLRTVDWNLEIEGIEVLLVGDAPTWYRGQYLWTPPQGEKQRDILASVLAAVRQLEGEEFIYASDDYYLTRETDLVGNFHYKELRRHVAERERAGDPYVRVLRDTARYLIGVPEALSWELHRPMRVQASGRANLILSSLLIWADKHQASPSWRTVYGVLSGARSIPRSHDGNYPAGWSGLDWISSQGEVPWHVKSMYIKPSRWER